MIKHIKQLIILCALVFSSSQWLSAHKSVFSIDEDSFTTPKGISSIEITDDLSTSSINYNLIASITDQNGNTSKFENVDSLQICNIDFITLSIEDLDNAIIGVAWYDENGLLISEESDLKIEECKSEIYNVEINTAFVKENKAINIICTDIEYEITELATPGSGSGILDFNDDGKLDLCIGESTYLTLNNLNPDQILNYSWLGLDDFLVGGRNSSNPKFFGFQDGNFNVVLQTSNQYGCTKQEQFSFSVNDIKNLEIQTTLFDENGVLIKTEVADTVFINCFPVYDIELSHTGVSTNGNVTVNWFDSNETLISTQASVLISPSLNSTYSVVVIDEFGCSDTKYITIMQNSLPEGEIVPLDIGVNYLDCTDEQLIVQFYHIVDSINGEIINPSWLLNGQTESFISSPIVTITESGNYELETNFETSTGCTFNISKSFEFELLNTNFIQDTIYACNSNMDLPINSNFNQLYQYTWAPNPYFDNLSLMNPIINPENSYVFELTVSNNFSNYTCQTQKTINLIVEEELNPIIHVEVLDKQAYEYHDQSLVIYQCDPFTPFTLFETNITDAAKFEWSRDSTFNPNNIIGSNQSLEVLEVSSDNEIIYFRAKKNNCYSSTFKIEILTLQNPTAQITFDYTPTFNCEPAILSLLANISSSPSEILEYSWTGPNGFSSSSSSPQINTNGSENGVYVLSLKNRAGCEESFSLTVSGIITPELADPVIQSTGLNCEGELVVLFVSEDMDSNNSYEWTYPSDVGIIDQGTNELIITALDESLHLGEYTVSVFNEDCISNTATFLIEPILNIIAPTESICNSENLSLEIDAPLGVSFLWQGPQNFYSEEKNPIISNVNVANNGIYSVEVLNSNGCSQQVNFSIDNILPQIETPIIQNNGPSCLGEPLMLSTSFTASTYDWIGPLGLQPNNSSLNTTESMTIIDADSPAYLSGDWKVMVNDEFGCTSISDPLSINITELPSAVILGDESVCEGNTLKIYAEQVSEAQYEWFEEFPSENTPVFSTNQSLEFSEIKAGFYTFYLRINLNDCPSEVTSKSFLIEDRPSTKTSFELLQHSNCNSFDLKLSAEVSGQDPFIYTWSGPNNFTSNDISPTISNITDANIGDYFLSVNDVNGCTSILNKLTINNLPELASTPLLELDRTPCANEPISIILSNYNGENFSLNWNTPAGANFDLGLNNQSIEISALDKIHEGVYSVDITLEDCTISSQNINLEVLEAPLVTIQNIESNLCQGDNLILSPQSTNVSSYLWSGPNGLTSSSTELIIENIDQSNNGLYTLIVESSDGCQAKDEIQIDQIGPSIPTPTLTSTSTSICEGEELNLSTSAVAVNYIWISPTGTVISQDSNRLQIEPNNVNYVSGVWSLQIENSKGCQSNINSASIEIMPTSATPLIESDNLILCEGDILSLSIVNAVNQDSFMWLMPNGIVITTSEPELIIEDVKPNLHNGNITVIAINQFCNSEESIPIDVSVGIQLNLEDQFISGSSCINETIQLNAPFVDGAEYLWTGPGDFSSTLQNPIIEINEEHEINGEYVLSISDNTSCSNTAVIQIDLDPGIEAPILDSENTSFCVGEDLVITTSTYVGSQIEYKWIFPDGSGVQNVVTQTNQLVIEDTDFDNEGNYSVAVFVDGCLSYSSEDLFIEINETPIVSIPKEYTFCSNEEINLTSNIENGSSPFDFLWKGPEGFISQEESPILSMINNAVSGVYTLTVTDANGCVAEEAFTSINIIDQPDTPIIESNNLQVCGGEEIIADIINYKSSSTYIWRLGDGSEIVSSEPTLSIDNVDSTANSISISVHVTDENCTSLPSNELVFEIIRVPNIIEISNTSIMEPVCEGDTIQLIAPYIEGANYNWIGPNEFVSTKQSPFITTSQSSIKGAYSLFIDLDGCKSDNFETVVDIEPLPAIPILNDLDIVCEGVEVFLEIQNPDPELLYSWYKTGSNEVLGSGTVFRIEEVSMNDAGNYFVIAQSAFCGSAESNQILLSVEEQEGSIAFAGFDDVVCEPDYLLGTNPLSNKEGRWEILDPNLPVIIDQNETYQTMVFNLVAGTNQFAWTLTNTVCVDILADTVSIVYTPYPEARDDEYNVVFNTELSSNVTLNDIIQTTDYTVSLTTQPLHGSLILSNGGRFKYTPSTNYVGRDKFTYKVCNNYCPEDCVEATVFLTIGEDYGCFVPSIFSPNGDNKNDFFTIPFLIQYSNSELTIFNRWGDQVYYSDDYRNEWDGTYKGGSLPSGTYYYILKVNDREKTEKYGYVFIQR